MVQFLQNRLPCPMDWKNTGPNANKARQRNHMKKQQQRNKSIAERCRRRPSTKNAWHIFFENTKACGSVLLCLDSFCSSSTKSQIENEVHIFSWGNLKLNQSLSENILYQERRNPCFKHHFFRASLLIWSDPLFQLTEKVQVTPLYDTCIHNSIFLQPIGTRLFILNSGLHTVSHYIYIYDFIAALQYL